jgi:hypothetical protein
VENIPTYMGLYLHFIDGRSVICTEKIMIGQAQNYEETWETKNF